MDVYTTIGVLIALAALFAFLNERFLRLEKTIGLMVLALTMTALLWLLEIVGVVDPLDKQRELVKNLDLSDTLLNGVLCFMLFAGSVNVKLKVLGQQKWVVGSLAIFGTLIAWLVIGLLIWGMFQLFGLDIAPIYAFLFGALISPTDPIAALAILGKVGMPERVETTISGESLFNDGVGVVLFTMCLAIAVSPEQPTFGDAVVLFLREVVGGITLGIATAVLMRWLLVHTKDYASHLLITLGLVTFGYALARHIEVSGPIAMVVTGLLIGNFTPISSQLELRKEVATFWHGIDEVLNALLFVLMGLAVVLLHPSLLLPVAGLGAVVVCLFGRAVSVYLTIAALKGARLMDAESWNLTKLLTWGGLRGGLALALALSIPQVPEKSAVVHLAFTVAAFSIIVQGLTVGRLFTAEQMKRMIK